MVVASDAMQGVDKDGKLLPWEANVTRCAGHPRTASSYSKTLELGRENGVPLMFTLPQLRYWNAKHLGDTGLKAMQERSCTSEPPCGHSGKASGETLGPTKLRV
jgi:N-acyl-D-amino-acid deacylase